MNAEAFVRGLSAVSLDHVFNPYADTCAVHDRVGAAATRRDNLRHYLAAVQTIGVDTIWMGRDLGYRGGRRTGLPLTDEGHLWDVPAIYAGCVAQQATNGPALAERTAAEIWAVLRLVELPPLLWNVFPFHPFQPNHPFSNRKFSASELARVDEFNGCLIEWLQIKRVIAIGQDAATYAVRFAVEVIAVRHPSYGGVAEFRAGMREAYGIKAPILPRKARDRGQSALF